MPRRVKSSHESEIKRRTSYHIDIDSQRSTEDMYANDRETNKLKTSLTSSTSSVETPKPRVFLSPIAAATMIATWNTTSTLMNFPNIFGQLGAAGGPIFTLFFQGLTYLMALFQVRMIAHYKSLGHQVDTFPQLGYCFFGKIGYRVFLLMQMANQVGFLPYALVLTTQSIQLLLPHVEFLSCNGNTMIMVILFCYILVQLSRDWKNFDWLSYVVFVSTIIQAGLLSSNVFSNPDLRFGPDKTLIFFGESYELPPNCTLPVVNTTCMDQDTFYTFGTFWDAAGSIIFSFAPGFILTELMAEMKNPEEDMKVAVTLAFSFSSLMNEYMGLVFVLIWGNQIPMGVQQFLPEGSAVNICSQLIILLAMVLDFVISVLVINRHVVLRYKPDFDFKWNTKNAILWAAVTFIPMTSTFMLSLFIPNLSSLITFVTALCIPYVDFSVVALCSFSFISTRGVSEHPIPRSLPLKVLLGCSAFLGIVISLIKFYQFILNLIELSFSGDYWCSQIGNM